MRHGPSSVLRIPQGSGYRGIDLLSAVAWAPIGETPTVGCVIVPEG